MKVRRFLRLKAGLRVNSHALSPLPQDTFYHLRRISRAFSPRPKAPGMTAPMDLWLSSSLEHRKTAKTAS
jgi:hypothetical protein